MTNRTREAARQDEGENDQLKGTFYSVLLTGVFLLAMWLIIFGLYLSRSYS